MDQIERNILHSAYMKTIFVIGDGQNFFEVSPLEVNQSFLKFLHDSGILSWAVITSDNPFSKPLSVEKNNERRKNLEIELLENGYKLLPALGRDPEGQLDPEYGYFIHNLSLKDALKIGKDYGQNAILFGEETAKSKIVWVEPETT